MVRPAPPSQVLRSPGSGRIADHAHIHGVIGSLRRSGDGRGRPRGRVQTLRVACRHHRRIVRCGRACPGAGRPDRRAEHRGSDRSGDRRLRRARHHQGPGSGRRPRDPAHGHAGRARRFHAPDHPGNPGVPRAGGGLRRPARRARGKRGHLHPVRQPRRGHGAGHQSRRGDACADRRRLSGHAGARGPAAGAAGRRRRRRRSRRREGGAGAAAGAAAPGRDGGQDHQRRRRLHPFARAAARSATSNGRRRRSPRRRACPQGRLSSRT